VTIPSRSSPTSPCRRATFGSRFLVPIPSTQRPVAGAGNLSGRYMPLGSAVPFLDKDNTEPSAPPPNPRACPPPNNNPPGGPVPVAPESKNRLLGTNDPTCLWRPAPRAHRLTRNPEGCRVNLTSTVPSRRRTTQENPYSIVETRRGPLLDFSPARRAHTDGYPMGHFHRTTRPTTNRSTPPAAPGHGRSCIFLTFQRRLNYTLPTL